MSAASSAVATRGGAQRRGDHSRRRAVVWDPGVDTAIALVTLLLFWGCYWAGSVVNEWFLLVGIVVVGTVIPAWTVLHLRREGLDGLGIRRRFLLPSLAVSLLLGAGSAYQLITVAGEEDIEVLPHLLGNLMVLWEPLFVFGWLYLRWERAFGWLPAIVLTGLGFTLHHVGAVPVEAALGFGAFALVFAVIFAFVRNLAILWPLFYPVASGIGTLQAGVVMGWSAVVSGAVLLVVQLVVLAVMWRLRGRDG